MTTTSFLTALLAAGSAKVRFMLPDGGLIPAHAHVTEVGRVDKRFIDCVAGLSEQTATAYYRPGWRTM
jgi:hypothetical protein